MSSITDKSEYNNTSFTGTKTLRIIAVIALILITCLVYGAGNSACAESDWWLNYSSMNIYEDDEGGYFYLLVKNAEPVNVISSDETVVLVNDWYRIYDNEEGDYEICLQRQGGGEAVITVIAADGTSRTCKIESDYPYFVLNNDNLIFNTKNPYDDQWIFADTESSELWIESARSSNNKVATVKVEDNCVIVTAKGKGKATITVTDNSGQQDTARVTVTKGWKKANLKAMSWGYVNYESTRLTGYTKPGAKVTIRIGGRKFTGRAKKSGKYSIKIKNHYKLNTKYSITFKYKGMSYTYKGKVSSGVWINTGTIWTCDNQVPLTVYNATKGDIVYVTVNGKTYRKKLTYSGTNYVTIYTDSNLGYTSYIKYKIKNKYKQKLYEYTWYVNW